MKYISVSIMNMLLVLFLSFLFPASIQSGNPVNDICTNPDSAIASEILKGKIVMLGEFPHHDFILYNGLINVLHNWLEVCKNDNSQDFTLNLVLEMDSLTAFYIDHYIKTDSDSVLYSRVAPFLYFEDIEFYENLRKAGMEIESMNEKRKSKISLNILGFEEVGLDNDEDHMRKNRQESEKWFVNDRDRNISDKLIEYMKSHNKTDHYLVYYGAAHLQSEYVNKNLGFSIPYEESFGYYLSYYLKQEFGEATIAKFVQGVYVDNVFDNTFMSRYSGKDFMISSDKVPENILKSEPGLFLVLRHFVRPYLKYEPHHFRMVFSSFVIKKLSERIEVLEKCLPGYKATQFYLNYLQSVSFITGERLENSLALEKWLKTVPEFDGLQKIDSKEHCSFIYELSKDTKSRNYGNILRDLGFDNDVYTYSERDSAYWYENWKNINKKAKFINAIGIYWIGYPQEKLSAKQYLIEFTGKDHSEPADYLKWYRKNFYGYEK